MGKQKNRVTKWSPVSPMDFPRFESWLEEMAGKGLLVHRVQQNLFSLARVKFRRDEPHPHRRYRVCPAQRQQQSQEKPSQELLELYAGVGAVLGHNFPVYAKFRGGKGIASSVGIVFGFDWRMVPVCAALFFLSVAPTGFMSLGSLGILSGFFIQTIVFGQMGWLKVASEFLPEVYVLSGILTGLAFWQHRANLKRLASGTENKFAPAKKKGKEEQQENPEGKSK